MNRLVQRVLSGERAALARFITLIEDRAPGWRGAMAALAAPALRARTIGITGPPGAGKSTLIAKIAAHYAAEGRKVAVLAFDPSSPFTGGAILGDRVRMREVETEEIFIRSMATRGARGGLSQAARDVTRAVAGAGFDLILIETVGIGQGEIDVAYLASNVVLVCVPGQGDVIQTIKAGVMEAADLYVINKADHEGADKLDRELHAMLSARGAPAQPAVVKTIATIGHGVRELAGQLLALKPSMRAHCKDAVVAELKEMLREDIERRVAGDLACGSALGKNGADFDPYELYNTLYGRRVADLFGAPGGRDERS